MQTRKMSRTEQRMYQKEKSMWQQAPEVALKIVTDNCQGKASVTVDTKKKHKRIKMLHERRWTDMVIQLNKRRL